MKEKILGTLLVALGSVLIACKVVLLFVGD